MTKQDRLQKEYYDARNELAAMFQGGYDDMLCREAGRLCDLAREAYYKEVNCNAPIVIDQDACISI